MPPLENAKHERLPKSSPGREALHRVEPGRAEEGLGRGCREGERAKLIEAQAETLEQEGENGANSGIAAQNAQLELICIELGMFLKQTDSDNRVERRFTGMTPQEQEKAWDGHPLYPRAGWIIM
jgi:hypothetical protein